MGDVISISAYLERNRRARVLEILRKPRPAGQVHEDESTGGIVCSPELAAHIKEVFQVFGFDFSYSMPAYEACDLWNAIDERYRPLLLIRAESEALFKQVCRFRAAEKAYLQHVLDGNREGAKAFAARTGLKDRLLGLRNKNPRKRMAF